MLFEKEKDADTQEISHADEFANTRNAVFLVKKIHMVQQKFITYNTRAISLLTNTYSQGVENFQT
jgi:hypothetical protein